MQSEPLDVTQNPSPHQVASDPAITSQHGQLRDNDLQDSLRPHLGGLRRESQSPTGGNTRDATRSTSTSDDGDSAEVGGLKGLGIATPPPKNRITEYENALSRSARKSPEGPLFEVLKSNRRPDDKSSPIANLPNGKSNIQDSARLYDHIANYMQRF